MAKLKATRVREVGGSDGLSKPGDFYVRDIPLAKPDGTLMPETLRAAILKCPFCGRDMATTHAHGVGVRRTLLGRIFRLSPVLTVSAVLQCPYSKAHRFYVKKGKVKAAK